MEFLRFGSSIPGSYWGCCAMCIIQNFKFDPDEKSSIQLVSGDGGGALMRGSEDLFAGPTYRDIFKQRIRIGTFSTQDMPDHAFLAVLTEEQVGGGHGKKWLKILKEEGFEFIRTVDNSVYTGAATSGSCSPHKNYLFGLFRNIGAGKVKDQFKPPKQWTDMEQVIPEGYQGCSSDGEGITKAQAEYHLKRWTESGPTRLLTRSEIEKAGAPVILAGLRKPECLQQDAKNRAALEAVLNKDKAPKAVPQAFAKAAVTAA